MGVSAKKFALRKKNGLKTALYGLLGEFFRGNACGWALLGEFFRGNAANSLTLGGMCQGQVLWSGVIVLCPSEWVMR